MQSEQTTEDPNRMHEAISPNATEAAEETVSETDTVFEAPEAPSEVIEPTLIEP